MKRAELTAEAQWRGCCNEPEGSDETLLARFDFEPPTYVPALIWVRPEAAPKINVLHGSAFIDFPVNRTEIHEDYRRNPGSCKRSARRSTPCAMTPTRTSSR